MTDTVSIVALEHKTLRRLRIGVLTTMIVFCTVVIGLGFAASFTAVNDFAVKHVEWPEKLRWVPSSLLDLFILIGILGVVWIYLSGRRLRDSPAAWYCWSLVALGTTASLIVNLAERPDTGIPSRIVAGAPPLSLALAVEAIVLIVRYVLVDLGILADRKTQSTTPELYDVETEAPELWEPVVPVNTDPAITADRFGGLAAGLTEVEKKLDQAWGKYVPGTFKPIVVDELAELPVEQPPNKVIEDLAAMQRRIEAHRAEQGPEAHQNGSRRPKPARKVARGRKRGAPEYKGVRDPYPDEQAFIDAMMTEHPTHSARQIWRLPYPDADGNPETLRYKVVAKYMDQIKAKA